MNKQPCGCYFDVALGENLHYIADALDQKIRQGDEEAIRKLIHLQTAWKLLCKVQAGQKIDWSSEHGK